MAVKAYRVTEDGFSASPVPPRLPDVRECGGFLPPRASPKHEGPRTRAMPKDGRPSRATRDPRIQGSPLIQRVPARPEIAPPPVLGVHVCGLLQLHRIYGLAPRSTLSSPPIVLRRSAPVGSLRYRGPVSLCCSPQAPTKPGRPWPEYAPDSSIPGPGWMGHSPSEVAAANVLWLSDASRWAPRQPPPTGQNPPRASRHPHSASPSPREVSP